MAVQMIEGWDSMTDHGDFLHHIFKPHFGQPILYVRSNVQLPPSLNAGFIATSLELLTVRRNIQRVSLRVYRPIWVFVQAPHNTLKLDTLDPTARREILVGRGEHVLV